VLVGCNGEPGPQGSAQNFTSNLGAFNMVLEKNAFEDEGFQYQLSSPGLMQGNRVTSGENFFLIMEFELSRDIDDDLLIFLVDNTSAADWWGMLTATGDDDADRIPAAKLKQGVTIEHTIEFTAIASASDATAAANKLVFETKNEAQSLAPITISFSSFVFGRGPIPTELPPTPPPPPTTTPMQFVFGGKDTFGGIDAELEADFFGFTIDGGSHNWALVKWTIDLTPHTLDNVQSVTFDYVGIEGDFNFKPVHILAANTGGLPTAGGFTAANFSMGSVETGNITANTPKSLTIEIDTDKAEGIASQFDIAFWISSNAAEWAAKNITFNVLTD
jgi:hypothetical protein